jgi:hypothetical protein
VTREAKRASGSASTGTSALRRKKKKSKKKGNEGRCLEKEARAIAS